MRWGTLSNPGPMVFPLLLGLMLLVLSIVLFVQSGSSPLSSFSELFQKGEGLKAIYIIGTFALCILIFEPLGFVISMFVLMVLLLRGIGGKTIVMSIFYGLVTTLPTYFLFTLLGVRLPKGILFF
jgi:putative tricarboxylic transport membrane protein